MNYQNNLDSYYYARKNNSIKQVKKKTILLWFLLLLFSLVFLWMYLKFFNTRYIEDDNNKINTPNTTKTISVDNIKGKVSMQNLSLTKEKPLTPLVKTPLQKQVSHSIPSNTSASMIEEISANKEKILEKPINVTATGDNINQIVKTFIEEQESHIESNSSVSTIKEIPASEERFVEKVIKMAVTEANVSNTNKIEESLPLDLYHIYIVSKGETMYDIAKKQYGDTNMYIKIVNANPDLDNPNNIHTGQEILLPIVDESKSYTDILRFK